MPTVLFGEDLEAEGVASLLLEDLRVRVIVFFCVSREQVAGSSVFSHLHVDRTRMLRPVVFSQIV